MSFFSFTGSAYCSEARLCSVPPAESVAVTDFSPAPWSVTTISTGASPSTSLSGVSVICGALALEARREVVAANRKPSDNDQQKNSEDRKAAGFFRVESVHAR